jgi:mono/diheme cytochrome c family protein
MGDRHVDRLLRRGAYALLAGVLATVVSLLAACGGGKQASTSSASAAHVQITQLSRDRWTYARERFREMCAGCHTLADAGSHGRRFILDRAGGISTDRARYAIEEGEPGMPVWRHVLSRREKEELISYVSTVARHDEGGETGWLWQIRLRIEGDRWRPPGTQTAGR